MSDEKISVLKGWPVYLVFVFLISVGIYVMVQRSKVNQELAADKLAYVSQHLPNKANISTEAPKLEDIIAVRRTWDTIMTNWYGRKAADFTVKTLDGKEFKLSEQAGKDVLIIFWATWCGYCVQEIPHLTVLKDSIPDSELAIVAITDEPATTIKRFVKGHKGINYTMALSGRNYRDLPEPYNHIYRFGRPAAMYIDKEGKIKLATVGTNSLTEMKLILRAK